MRRVVGEKVVLLPREVLCQREVVVDGYDTLSGWTVEVVGGGPGASGGRRSGGLVAYPVSDLDGDFLILGIRTHPAAQPPREWSRRQSTAPGLTAVSGKSRRSPELWPIRLASPMFCGESLSRPRSPFLHLRPPHSANPAVTMVNFTVEQLRQVRRPLVGVSTTMPPLRLRQAHRRCRRRLPPLPDIQWTCWPKGLPWILTHPRHLFRPTARPRLFRLWTTRTTFVRCP